jgi:hypothetical protein
MTEAPHDNALQREFVGHFRVARISSRCASRGASSNLRRSFVRRISIELLLTTHNPCVRIDRNDHTGQNPGDKLPAGR